MILCRGRLGNLRPECITKFSHNKHLTNLKYGQFNPEVRRKLKDFLTNLPSRTETTTKIPSLSPIYTRLNYSKLFTRYLWLQYLENDTAMNSQNSAIFQKFLVSTLCK